MDWNGRSVALVGIAALLAATLVTAQSVEEWVAPPEARGVINALSATNPEHIKKGRTLFVKHCVTCHGERGRGDGPSARLHARRSGYAPRDLSRADVQAGLTDGELFWKIGQGWRPKGRVVMPGIGDEVSEEDRWRIVIYVRSLAQKAGAR
jgi:mono/diheme cytochrome c family protein